MTQVNSQNGLAAVVHRLETQLANQIYTKYFTGLDTQTTLTLVDKSEFMDKIMPHKVGKLSQDDTVREELETIARADECYEDDPDLYPDKRTEYGYPDQFRCNFIIYRRNRFSRCSNVISKEDPDDLYCCKHSSEYCEYADAYAKIKERLEDRQTGLKGI
jgi:hypothetical protein